MYAAEGGSIEICNRLLDLGADPKAADDEVKISTVQANIARIEIKNA